MNKEEITAKAQKFLELKEPVLVDIVAPKIAKHAQIVYLVGLVLLAISLLGTFVMLFNNPSVALLTLIFIAVEFVLLRMFCEFLLTYTKNSEENTPAGE